MIRCKARPGSFIQDLWFAVTLTCKAKQKKMYRTLIDDEEGFTGFDIRKG